MERLQQEFEAIGFYLSAHPLDAYEQLEAPACRSAASICRLDRQDGRSADQAGRHVIGRARAGRPRRQSLRLRPAVRRHRHVRGHGVLRVLARHRELLEPGRRCCSRSTPGSSTDKVRLTGPGASRGWKGRRRADQRRAQGLSQRQRTDRPAVQADHGTLRPRQGASRLVAGAGAATGCEVAVPGSLAISTGDAGRIEGHPGHRGRPGRLGRQGFRASAACGPVKKPCLCPACRSLRPRPLQTARGCRGRRGEIPLGRSGVRASDQLGRPRPTSPRRPTGKGQVSHGAADFYHAPAARSWRPLRPPDPPLEPEDGALSSSACATGSTSSISRRRVPLLAPGAAGVRDVAAAGGRVLFVGTKRQAAEPIADGRQALRPVLREPPLAGRHADQLEDHLALDQAPARAGRACSRTARARGLHQEGAAAADARARQARAVAGRHQGHGRHARPDVRDRHQQGSDRDPGSAQARTSRSWRSSTPTAIRTASPSRSRATTTPPARSQLYCDLVADAVLDGLSRGQRPRASTSARRRRRSSRCRAQASRRRGGRARRRPSPKPAPRLRRPERRSAAELAAGAEA